MAKKKIISKTPHEDMSNEDYVKKHGTRLPRGYDEDEPDDPGQTLDKKPDKEQKKNPSGRKGKHGSGTVDGPGQELPKLRGSK